MTRAGGIGGESDIVALRAGTEVGEPAPPGEAPHIVPRDVPIDDFTDLPEGLKEYHAREREARDDAPKTEPTREAGPAS
ncbi:hypothetical protein ACSNOI_29645 [Actinomadura kijaniata]|uniref:hypothetical protein n=1 Tax=Actinomadura kijaniata TaxID=46161 RepID=UPI003F1CA08F